ncbi:MAG: aminopeptidase [Microbacteriaceae bacterium]
MDPRWAQLANQLAVGTELQAGDMVSIFITDNSVFDAVDAFVAEVYRRGALPQVINSDERFDRSAMEHAPDEFLAMAAPMEAASMKWADVHVSFRGMTAPIEEQSDPERLALQRKGKGIVSTLRWENTRWALVRIPTPDWAALINKDLNDLLDEFFSGCIADWDEDRKPWEKVAAIVEAAGSLRMVADDTDLTLSHVGRKWITFAGGNNFPDGEIASAPVDDSTEGYITFPELFWFAGARVKNLRLDFEKGAVVKVTADEGQELVQKLVNTDEGAKRIGEVAIGMNGNIQTMTGDLLFDEKILGTAHIALGRAYPICLGINESSLHWDIVKDLRRPDGYLYAGDKLLIDKGVPTALLLTGEED